MPDIVCSVNEDKEKIRDNIKKNIKRGLAQVSTLRDPVGEEKFGLVLGGPTLKETFPDVSRKKTRMVCPVITVNGSLINIA